MLVMACGDQAASVGDAMDSAKESAGNAMDSAKETAGGAMDSAKETAGNAMDSAKESAGNAMDKVSGMAAPGEAVTATIDAVKSAGGDITALSPDAAVGNINTWIEKLGSMDGTEGVVDGLKSLKTELTSGEIDGSKVSTILSSLAEKTRELGGDNMAVGTIASALDAGAKKLGGQ